MEPDEEYQRYLELWASHFGAADSGDYGYWRFGRYVPVTVHRLTLEEYHVHVAALDAAHAQFQIAHAAQDLAGMDQALAASLPHELALLV